MPPLFLYTVRWGKTSPLNIFFLAAMPPGIINPCAGFFIFAMGCNAARMCFAAAGTFTRLFARIVNLIQLAAVQ